VVRIAQQPVEARERRRHPLLVSHQQPFLHQTKLRRAIAQLPPRLALLTAARALRIRRATSEQRLKPSSRAKALVDQLENVD
jgi:hypothetical protein